MRHVAVLDPGTRIPELDSFNRMARTSPIPLTYHLPALHGMDSVLRAEEGLVGVVVLGSGASVHDDLAWQDALSDWLKPRLLAGLPVLGLCYGHQLLAHLLGGEVGFVSPDQEKLRGVRAVSVPPDPLWGAGGEGLLVVSHRECVTRAPDSVIVRAATAACSVEAFAHRSLPIRGFQAHPEATTAFTTGNAILFDEDPAVLSFGHGLVDSFLRRVQALATAPGAEPAVVSARLPG